MPPPVKVGRHLWHCPWLRALHGIPNGLESLVRGATARCRPAAMPMEENEQDAPE